MTQSIIEDWLTEYSELTPEELQTFISATCYNQEVVNAVFAVLEDRVKYNSLVETVCDTLFSFYRKKEVDLQRFTLSFVPTLIYVYLNAVAHGEKKNCRGIEALLVGIYNLEAVDENCHSNNVSFRLPSLAQASLYHEPLSLAPASFTEAALRRLEECDSKLVRWGPMPQYNKIIAANRLSVMTSLLFVFNRHIASLPPIALLQLCKVASKLVGQGFSKPGKRIFYSSSDVAPVLPRIPVSQPFLLQLLYSLYFSIFNGHETAGVQAMEEVHQRACYQGFSEVLLVTNAIKNSTHFHAGQANDITPMGITMAPATTSTVISKSMITNASFRTKKLPEDIPIQVSKGEAESSGLGSISEEKEASTEPAKESSVSIIESRGGPRRSLSKMAVSFGKKAKESAL